MYKRQRWYDGYELGDYHVYNPNAVVNAMINKSFQSYWSQTGTYESIVPFINMNFDGLKTAVIEMLSGATAQINAVYYTHLDVYKRKTGVTLRT